MKPRMKCLASILSITTRRNQAQLITYSIQSQRWKMVVAASSCGVIFSVRVEGKMNGAKHRDIFNENLDISAHDFSLGWRFTFQQDNEHSHGIAGGQLLWIYLIGPTRTQLNPIKHLWRHLKMSVHWGFSSTLRSLKWSALKNGRQSPNSGCGELVTSYPRGLDAVTAAKGALTKYWEKGLNTYVFVILVFSFYLQKFLRFSSLCFNELLSVFWWIKKWI